MKRCCRRCFTGTPHCHNHACRCHQAAREAQKAADLGETISDAKESSRDERIGLTEDKRRAILAAQIGIDSAFEVARAYKVPVGAVRAIWKTD